MNTDIAQKDDIAWQRYVKAYRELVETGHSSDWDASVEAFLAEDVNRIPFLQRLNSGAHWERLAALYILPKIAADELQIIFREIIYLAAYTIGKASFIRSVIYSMPRDWVVANIERFAEEHLVPSKDTGTYSEYRRLLELYSEIDAEMTIRLANRAIQNTDLDIREAGEEFLDYYKDLLSTPKDSDPEHR